jgi:hypothetical protein
MATTPHQPFGLQHTPSTPMASTPNPTPLGWQAKPLDRITTNAAHRTMTETEVARTNAPLLMRLERRRRASKWQGLAELRESIVECGRWCTLRPEAPHLQQLTPPNLAEPVRPPSPKATEPSQPTQRLQEGYDVEAPLLADPTSGPRVSPGTKGRSGSTQDHASKEKVAPIGVTVIRNGRAEQGFHPDRAAHPGEEEMSKCKHSATAAGSLSTRRSTSTMTMDYPARQEETEVVSPKQAGTPRFRSKSSGHR